MDDPQRIGDKGSVTPLTTTTKGFATMYQIFEFCGFERPSFLVGRILEFQLFFVQTDLDLTWGQKQWAEGSWWTL